MLRIKIYNFSLSFLSLFLSLLIYSDALAGEEEAEERNRVYRLSTHEEHVGALESAFKSAGKSVLVTNYGNLYTSVLKTPLFTTIIPEARHRNVQVYFRFNYSDKESRYSPIPSEVEKYFHNYGINAAWTQTHAKIVAVDSKLVMVGSFNWLSDLTVPVHYRSFNSTLVFEGDEACRMTDDIWKVLKYYRNKEFGEYNRTNHRKAYLFKRNPDNQLSRQYVLDDESTLTYVPVIEEHRRKLLDIFERAKKRIVIFSPFVSWDGVNTYQRDFVRNLLTTVLERNVSVCFVCLPDHEKRYRDYLGDLFNYSNLKLKTFPHLHAKTIIMDDKLIGEGSFNWLCAARDEIYHTHKHEATLIFEGSKAKDFIQSFYQTDLGRLASEDVYVEHSSSDNKKRKYDEKLPPRKKLKPNFSDEERFFSDRRMEIEKDMWVHYPFWTKYSDDYIYLVYGKYFEIMSGERFNREGYCVRINKQEYLRDDQNIKYFNDIQKAKEATYTNSTK
ncbi:MAG: hypothetical protein HON43_05510 [Alphaproteobacteria bacterium]|jgi:hypothetical protein|nr:hypothetical protein [Alphaproteobacteria bacterium]MBT5390328.1 hypothetical protein [Alphaproteobacteria bacterium]